VIFLDANVILRYLTRPTTRDARAMHEAAKALFRLVRRGDEEVTTTEVVLHEVAYVLAARSHYNLPAADVAAALKSFLNLRGVKLPTGERRLYLRALDLYAANPQLGFADAAVAERVRAAGIPLATFDAHFDGLAGITRWRPPASPTQPRRGRTRS
jgi:predicted nucleic acid-binding protein